MLTLFQTTALTDGLDQVGTAHYVGVLITTGLERGGALGQAALVNTSFSKESAALSSFSPVVVAGVSRNSTSQTEKADGESRCNVNHFA